MTINDDVDRSYYVYAHRDKETGKIFYIGKGNRKRAHNKKERGGAWLAKVNSLKKGYEVEIIKEGLTEDESFELEIELITKYGKECDGKGDLVNILDGGESGFGLSIKLPDGLSSVMQLLWEKDYEQTNYKEFSDVEEKLLLNEINDTAIIHYNRLEELEEEYTEEFVEDTDIDDYQYQLSFAIGALDDVSKIIKRRLKKKISQKDCFFGIEDACEEIEVSIEEMEKCKVHKATEYAKQSYEALMEIINRIKLYK